MWIAKATLQCGEKKKNYWCDNIWFLVYTPIISILKEMDLVDSDVMFLLARALADDGAYWLLFLYTQSSDSCVRS